MQWIRKYRQYLVGLSLAIFVLPAFSIFCQSCLDMASSEHSMAHHANQSDHSCCKHESQDSPAMVNGAAGCCEPELSETDISSLVFVFAEKHVEKFIRVSSIPLPVVLSRVVVYRHNDPSANLAYASLSFRNPVLLN